jgi:hypothetical protein
MSSREAWGRYEQADATWKRLCYKAGFDDETLIAGEPGSDIARAYAARDAAYEEYKAACAAEALARRMNDMVQS